MLGLLSKIRLLSSLLTTSRTCWGVTLTNYRLKLANCSSPFVTFPKTGSRKMPGNVEVKAKVKDIQKLRKLAKALTEEHYPLQQCDVFFKALVGDCRLKMRMEENESTGEKKAMLIAYSRPDVTGPKFSHYVLTPVEDPKTMEEALKMSNGVLGKVEKKRDAYIVQRNGLSARIHLDVVKDLGDFLEFEVIVKEDSQMEEAHSFAEYLSEYFGVSKEDTLPGAYFNLLQK